MRVTYGPDGRAAGVGRAVLEQGDGAELPLVAVEVRAEARGGTVRARRKHRVKTAVLERRLHWPADQGLDRRQHLRLPRDHVEHPLLEARAVHLELSAAELQAAPPLDRLGRRCVGRPLLVPRGVDPRRRVALDDAARHVLPEDLAPRRQGLAAE